MGELAEMGGSYAEAVGFLNRALVVFEACLGVDHDETTKTALKLAAIQSHQSDYYQQALTMYEQALEVSGGPVPSCRTALSCRHPVPRAALRLS